MSEGALTTFFSAFVTLLVTAITAGATLSASARPIPGWLKIVGGGATVGMIIFGTQLIQVSIADPPILPSMSIPVPSISPTTPGEVQGVTTATIVAIPSLEPTNSDSNIGNITTIVPNTETLRVGNFEFNYGSGLSNHATGTYGRGQPQQGRWLIVLLYVKNVGSEPAKIPDNFFAVKDMQGRISYRNVSTRMRQR